VRSRVCGGGGVRAPGVRARAPGRWERALGILLASQRGEQEARARRAGERGALPRTRRARSHTRTHALPASLAAAATISEPSPAERAGTRAGAGTG
jgi:hypothetical protein